MLDRLPIVYFHGAPGSPREMALFGKRALDDRVYSPDRTRWRHCSEHDNLDRLAAHVHTYFDGEPVRIVAFSLGVRPALLIAARLGGGVGAIDLVSPAAPLDGSDYRGMAGRAVFELAARTPRLFALLTRLEAAAVRFAPALLYDRLFATAQGVDRELSRQPPFRAMMCKVLADSLAYGTDGYRADVLSYVAPWGDVLASVSQPTTLWHGQADNWAPVTMSKVLADRLPNVTDVHRLAGLSHYSTLAFALRALLPRSRLLSSNAQ